MASASEEEAKKAGVRLHRQPIVDFSFDSLREQLPEAASEFDRLMNQSDTEVIYCHCTAGMGRSPAVVIAYLYWTDDRFESLDAAYEFLTSKRPCGPKKEAIRQATVDILESEGDSLPTRDGKMKVDAGRYYGDDSKKLKEENLDSRGTTLTKAQRETIKKKLRVKSGTYVPPEKKKGGVLEILKRFFLRGTNRRLKMTMCIIYLQNRFCDHIRDISHSRGIPVLVIVPCVHLQVSLVHNFRR